MEQRIPKISNEDIKRIILRDFPHIEYSEIENILSMYKSESNKGKNRIYASALKLSNGSFELVKKYVEKANQDYRDIISLSEYPNYSEYAFEIISSEKKKQLISDDWIQFEAWLNK